MTKDTKTADFFAAADGYQPLEIRRDLNLSRNITIRLKTFEIMFINPADLRSSTAAVYDMLVTSITAILATVVVSGAAVVFVDRFS